MRPLLFRVLRFSAVIAALMPAIFKAQIANAQLTHWQPVPIPDSVSITDVYFFNQQYGFASSSNIEDVATGFWINNSSPFLYRTTDGGLSWSKIIFQTSLVDSLPSNFGYGNLLYLSPSHLLIPSFRIASSWGQGATKFGLFESLDSGLTWSDITPTAVTTDCRSVYASGDTTWVADWSPATGKYLQTDRTVDNGSSWTRVNDGYAISGNKTGLLLSVSDSYEISSNDGLSWGGTQPMPSDSVPFDYVTWLVKPLTNDIFFTEDRIANPVNGTKVNTGEITVSSDGGLTFHKTDTTAGLSFGEIEGAAGVCTPVYVQKISDSSFPGFLRSTDEGITWQNIEGPGASLYERHHPFSVVGYGAVVFAVDGSGTLWETTDGGDGSLTSSVLPMTTVNFSMKSSKGKQTVLQEGDTISTKLCDSLVLDFRVINAGCNQIWIDSSSIDSIVPNTYYSVLHNRALTVGSPSDTSQIVILPVQEGTYSITVHGRIRRDDYLNEDKSISLTLIIQPNPGVLDLTAKTLYDFGTQALCTPVTVRDTFSIAAHGCEQVTVDSVVFHPDSVQFTDITFMNSGTFIPDSTPKDFPISFKPSIADTERGNIFIYWFDGETRHTDTIPTQGVGVTDTRTFAIHADTLSIRMCDSTTGTITITNTTCGTLTLDSLSLPNGVVFGPGLNPALPIVLASGGSDSLIVHLALGRAGSTDLRVGDTALQAIASMQFTEHGSSSDFDTTLMLNVHVGRGIPAVTLSTPSLNFGSVTTCGQSVTLPVVLSSTACDTLTCSGAVPALPYTLTKSFLSSVPVGVSDTALVTFTPTATGQFNDTLTITTNAGMETVPLQGVGIAGAKVLSVDTSLRDFGALYACQSRDTTILLRNTGCDTLIVDSGNVTNGSYVTDANYPIILPPDSSATVQVSLAADSAGMSGTLEFFSNANQGNSMVTIPLTASIIPPAHLELALSPSDTATAGSVVRCYVILEGKVPTGAISGLHFDITHNDDLLTYESASGVTMLGTGGTPALQVLQFSAGSPAGSLTYADTIGTITFRVYLSDSSYTPLTLSNVSFTNSLELAANCVASIADSGASFTYLYSCGEPLIQDGMLGTLPFVITGIVPNPAQDEITVQLSGNEQPEIEMYDALGRGQDVRSTSLQSGVLLDVSNVPSGIYFLRLSMDGYMESRSIVIAH